MSHWLTIGGPALAVSTALAISAAIIGLGRQSEDTDHARRRRALGRAASRARAQAPTPVQLPWTPRRRRFGRGVKPGGPMICVSGSFGTLWARAEAMHWDQYFGVTVKRPAYTDLVESLRLTRSRSIGSAGHRRVVEAIEQLVLTGRSCLLAGDCVEIESGRIGGNVSLRVDASPRGGPAVAVVLSLAEAFDVGASLIHLSGFEPPKQRTRPGFSTLEEAFAASSEPSEHELARRAAQQDIGDIDGDAA